MAEESSYNEKSQDNPEGQTEQEERDYWWGLVSSFHEYTKEKFDNECQKYIRAFRHEFARNSQTFNDTNRVDVNVVFPIIKSTITNIYFKDPKCFVKPKQGNFSIPVTQLLEDGQEQPVIDPMTGMPEIREIDIDKAASKFGSLENLTIKESKLKYAVKSALVDASLMPYGVVKCGFGNDQGVASMGEGAPPSVNETVSNELCYSVRLKPWDVVVDLNSFYNPHWIAIRYCVPFKQLKNDRRLNYTEEIKGKVTSDDAAKQKYFKKAPNIQIKYTEYYEVFVKPCADYPKGAFFMLSEEVESGFLFKSDWPYGKLKKFPVKIFYFNEDPEGDLPVPEVRYYFMQQKAKINLRNAAYEYVQRFAPIVGIDASRAKDPTTLVKQVTSNQLPRYVLFNGRVDQALTGFTPPPLGTDFYNLDLLMDQDTARTTGMVSPSTPTTDPNQLATSLKIAASGEQLRQSEKADLVTDFITEILECWADLYREFLVTADVSVDGEKLPVEITNEEIQGRFSFEIKPFSMSYEDPAVLRKQYVDLLNLLASPEARAALAEQGVQVNLVYIIKRILDTYQERDIENFIDDSQAKPETQILDALQENAMIQSGQGFAVQVAPTDNDKLHILIHQLLGPLGAEHILQHQASMQAKATGSSSGGGNQEGLPVNGVASNQDLMNQSAQPSPTNQQVAINRESGAY